MLPCSLSLLIFSEQLGIALLLSIPYFHFGLGKDMKWRDELYFYLMVGKLFIAFNLVSTFILACLFEAWERDATWTSTARTQVTRWTAPSSRNPLGISPTSPRPRIKAARYWICCFRKQDTRCRWTRSAWTSPCTTSFMLTSWSRELKHSFNSSFPGDHHVGDGGDECAK